MILKRLIPFLFDLNQPVTCEFGIHQPGMQRLVLGLKGSIVILQWRQIVHLLGEIADGPQTVA